jgi:hypothetical protein
MEKEKQALEWIKSFHSDRRLSRVQKSSEGKKLGSES